MNILRPEDVATVRQAAMVLGGFHKGELARRLRAVADSMEAAIWEAANEDGEPLRPG